MKYEQPFDQPGNPSAPYVNGNPGAGIQGSIPPAAVFQNPQTEIVNLISDSGLTPTDGDLHQLGEAVQSGRVAFGVDTGTTNAIVTNLVPPPTAYRQGMTIRILLASTILGATTINCNSLGNKTAKIGGLGLTSGLLNAGDIGEFVYDGTFFQLIGGARGAPGAPVFLTAPQTYYVNNATGSDSNNGLTSGTAFKTIQKALSTITLFNLNGFTVTVNVADGTYAPFFTPNISGSGSVQLVGNTASPASCIISGTLATSISAGGIGNYGMNGFTVQNTGPNTGTGDACFGIYCSGAGVNLSLQNMIFGPTSGPHMGVTNGAIVTMTGTIYIAGGSSGNLYIPGCHLFASGGQVFTPVPILTTVLSFINSVAFPGSFINAQDLAVSNLVYASINLNGHTVTGPRYSGAGNAIIQSDGGGTSYYPGNSAGSLSSGAQYL